MNTTGIKTLTDLAIKNRNSPPDTLALRPWDRQPLSYYSVL